MDTLNEAVCDNLLGTLNDNTNHGDQAEQQIKLFEVVNSKLAFFLLLFLNCSNLIDQSIVSDNGLYLTQIVLDENINWPIQQFAQFNGDQQNVIQYIDGQYVGIQYIGDQSYYLINVEQPYYQPSYQVVPQTPVPQTPVPQTPDATEAEYLQVDDLYYIDDACFANENSLLYNQSIEDFKDESLKSIDETMIHEDKENVVLHHLAGHEMPNFDDLLQHQSNPATTISLKASCKSSNKNKSYKKKFAFKLYNLVNDSQTDAIKWTEHGDSFEINYALFESECQSKVSRSKKISSFVRSLNMYGFVKRRKTRKSDKNIFSHPHFIRGDKESLKLIQRVRKED